MIYKSTHDPVFIKTIPIKTWKLRDEIYARLKAGLPASATKEERKKKIKALSDEYSGKTGVDPEKKLDTSEDEMAKALEEGEEEEKSEDAEASEEEKEEKKEEEKEGDKGDDAELDLSAEGDNKDLSGEDEMAKAMAEAGQLPGNKGPQRINMRKRPDLDDDQIAHGMLILAEINMEEARFFTTQKYTIGQSIVVEFLLPQIFILSAEIIQCMAFNISSKVIGVRKPAYRVLCKFTFIRPGERTLLRKFAKSIEPDPVIVQKKQKVEEEDDFDDLGL